ncbi:hypothetical protein HZS_3681, partial [Henneguya salminicola]
MVDECYKFRCFLKGHTSDIKSIAVSPDGNIMATISRDKTCKLWKLENNSQFDNYCTFSCGEKYGMAIKYFEFDDNKTILIGGLDKSLTMHSLIDGSIMREYKGHTDCVSTIDIYDNKIISGSWDCSVILWDLTGIQLQTFNYHSAAVWVVRVVGYKFLSGSADSNIVLWENGLPSKTFFGHEGPVRDIAILRIDTEFLSCSNDSTIRLWDMNNGQCLKVLTAHKHFVYSLVAFPKFFLSFVSCGEEKSLKVWSDLKIVDDIVVPGLSNWCVGILPNSDIVVASSLPDVMIFTRDKTRIADEISHAEFSSLIGDSLNSQSALKDIDINSLASADCRASIQGAHDGQTKMFRQDDQIVVYQWNLKAEEWEFVGNALREVNEDEKHNSKIFYDGAEYDHVIDVELENGQKLKLAYNNGEDPEDAAVRFIDKNSLDMFYHKQIVDFLIVNVPSAASYKNNDQI